jgi:hypothetical protein
MTGKMPVPQKVKTTGKMPVPQKMDGSRQQFETTVLRRLAALGRRLRLYVLLDGLAVLSAVALLAVVTTLAVDYTARLDRDMRAVQLVSLLVVLLGIAWWRIVRPLRVVLSVEHLAVLVERRFPQLSSILVSAVEFATQAGGASDIATHSSRVMRHEVIRGASQQAAGVSFEAVLAHDRAWRRGVVTLGCALAIVVLSLAARDTMGLWFRRNVLLENVPWPQRNRLTLENIAGGKIVSPRNEDVTVSAVVDRGYEPPRQAFVEFENGAGVVGREQMPAVSQREVRFTHTFERLAESLRFRVVGGDAATDWVDIEVVDRPQIRNAVIQVAPPRYTRAESYELRAGQTAAEVLNGSEVRFHIESNKPLKRAMLVREDTANREIEVGEAVGDDGVHFTSTTRPAATSTYQYSLLDELGLSNRGERIVPMRFNIRLIADKPPTVKMRIKDVGDMVTREAVLPIEGTFEDQYGLASAAIACEVGREGVEPAVKIESIDGFEPGTRTFAHTAEWQVAQHGAIEGDRLTLSCQASDFDDVAGPNVGKSATIALRVVSSEELLADLSRREQEHRRDFERLLRQQEELYNDMLAAARPQSAEEARQFFPRLARRQRDHAGRLNLLRLQFAQVLSKLRMNQLATAAVEARLGQGVIEPMDELYRESIPRAAAALEPLPPDATGDALKDARAAQEQVLAEMNRIMASLLKWEGYQEAVTLLRDVLKMQKTLGEETEKRVEEQILGPATSSAPSER